MSEKKYTKQHEWILLEERGTIGVIGISDHAQDQLGDVVFVELPDIGRSLEANGEMAVVESNKAASDVFAPVAGEVIAVNSELEDHPELINESPENHGWMVKVRVSSATDVDNLMSADAYQEFLKSEETH